MKPVYQGVQLLRGKMYPKSAQSVPSPAQSCLLDAMQLASEIIAVRFHNYFGKRVNTEQVHGSYPNMCLSSPCLSRFGKCMQPILSRQWPYRVTIASSIRQTSSKGSPTRIYSEAGTCKSPHNYHNDSVAIGLHIAIRHTRPTTKFTGNVDTHEVFWKWTKVRA